MKNKSIVASKKKYFTIKINTFNHFLNNRAQTLNDYNLEMEGVSNMANGPKPMCPSVEVLYVTHQIITISCSKSNFSLAFIYT